MYGVGGNDDREEFLRAQQQQQQQPGGSQYNFDYYAGATEASLSSAPAGPTVTPEYPTASTSTTSQSQFNQFNHSASTGSATNAAPFSTGGAFDNIDISRNNSKFSSGTPFETVHEFVSVSNRVSHEYIRN